MHAVDAFRPADRRLGSGSLVQAVASAAVLVHCHIFKVKE